jgi:aconitate hydratase
MIGAVNFFNNTTNNIKNHLTGQYGPVPESARAYKNAGTSTIIIGDENYGEGSSREHAAMEPRNLGVRVILARSFARIHETNLKKQGMLALTFIHKEDYDKIREDDLISVKGLDNFTPEKTVNIILTHSDGSTDEFPAAHSYSKKQIEWFKAGSALNLIKQLQK